MQIKMIDQLCINDLTLLSDIYSFKEITAKVGESANMVLDMTVKQRKGHADETELQYHKYLFVTQIYKTVEFELL